ncbi:MAG: ergothioneine biosynthesis protein EgtB [Acidobacteriota bacterium]|nr:ergothioneine biosynthesis protein EgtB [Acidobacteriota bacterium]
MATSADRSSSRISSSSAPSGLPPIAPPADSVQRADLLAAFRSVRATSLRLCEPLAPEDYRIQSMPDVSPPWWNLGHTSWFFARNILQPEGLYQPEDERLEYVLNSYYQSLGPRLERARRGLVTRPTTDEVLRFRATVDGRLERLIEDCPEDRLADLAFLVTTGIHHEQQHQELLTTEIKHILGTNVGPLREAYLEPSAEAPAAGDDPGPSSFLPVEGGLVEIGNREGGWCWDNEMPVHRSWLDGYALLDRLVTNGEYLEFIQDGGYEDPLLWLSNGWARRQEEGWSHPLYWEQRDGRWWLWTLGGVREVDPAEPVCHVSFYEADAFLRWRGQQDDAWRGARLPTEQEWEHGARTLGFDPAQGNFLDDHRLHPAPARGSGLRQAAGDLWEWTSSHYEPYPRYRPFEGSLMEYNGKFMDNQRVLRGGSCGTPRDHIRVSYRNFWPADTRFQWTGIRPARDL